MKSLTCILGRHAHSASEERGDAQSRFDLEHGYLCREPGGRPEGPGTQLGRAPFATADKAANGSGSGGRRQAGAGAESSAASSAAISSTSMSSAIFVSHGSPPRAG